MRVETCRIVEAVCVDGVLGINAQIDALTLDTPIGSGVPDTRPAHVTIINAIDDDATVREADTTFPVVVIDAVKVTTAAGQAFSGIRDYKVDILIGVVAQSGDVTLNERTVDYILRAIIRTIARGLLASGKRDTAGTRNGFAVSKSSELTYGPAKQHEYGGVMLGAVEFSLTVRDLQP
jgi:hypothetical protein